MIKFDLQMFGGGGKSSGSSSSSSSYTPTAQELELQQYAVDNAKKANPGISSLIEQFNSGVQSQDFRNQLGNSSNIISNGQNSYASLMKGELPSSYTDNMSAAIKTGVNNTVGEAVNNLAGKGVINSSVTSDALNNIEKNVSDTMAQSYNTNINTLAGLTGNSITSATAGYNPYSALQNIGTTQYNAYGVSPLSAVSGKGTTSSTQSQQQGLGSQLGQALMIASMFA